MSGCLDGRGALRWLALAVSRLEQARERVNALNVFPIPDGDTGTNLLCTLRAAQSRALAEGRVADGGGPADGGAPTGGAVVSVGPAVVEPAGARLIDVLDGAALGAMEGALGNSGTIVAQFWTALAAAARRLEPGVEGFDGPGLAAALVTAADAMRGAVAEPVEGTILTVADHVAKKAGARGPRDLLTVSHKACRDAVKALARTEDQLPALAAAGVVDAGACGLVLILAALAEAISGQRPAVGAWAKQEAGSRAAADDDGQGGDVELIFLVRPAGGEARAALYRALGDLGGSLSIAQSATIASVHIHCLDPDAVIAAARAALPPTCAIVEQRREPLRPQLPVVRS